MKQRGTPLLRLLRQKRLLKNRLAELGLTDNRVLSTLRRVETDPNPGGGMLAESEVRRLEQSGLLAADRSRERARSPAAGAARRATLRFVTAVNFELTYDCDYACPHCLQLGLRSRRRGIALDRPSLERAIQEARFAGLVETGVNFTGGEPLLGALDVFALLAYCQGLGVATRLNTNASWGAKDRFRAGGRAFTGPEDLVAALQAAGLSVLALSVDPRYQASPHAFAGLVGAVRACESQRLPYQLVCTRAPGDRRTQRLLDGLQAAARRPLRFAQPVPWPLVELGGAAAAVTAGACAASREGVVRLVPGSDCGGRGFYRPLYLHVDPAGGVRSCAFAPGLRNLGNIREDGFFGIVNRFGTDSVSRSLREDLEGVSALYRPTAWRAFSHPCTASAVLARLLEETRAGLGIEEANALVAAEFCLSA